MVPRNPLGRLSQTPNVPARSHGSKSLGDDKLLLVTEDGSALEGETRCETQKVSDGARERRVQIMRKDGGLEYKNWYQVRKNGVEEPHRHLANHRRLGFCC